MRVRSAIVDGFRLLDGVELTFETSTTIIVGRNNSGKTSFVELFHKFLGPEKGSFSIDDFTLTRINDFTEAGNLWTQAILERTSGNLTQAEALEASALAKLPFVSLEVEFAYEEDDDLTPISNLILDLDPTRTDATLVCAFRLSRPREFLNAFADSDTDDILLFARRRMRHFGREFTAVDRQDRANVRGLEAQDVRNALSANFIYAQTLFDDTSLDTGHGLSKGLESYYRAIANTDGTVESLESVLGEVGVTLNGEYATLFESVFSDLRLFGVKGMPSLPEVQVISEFRAADLLKGSTKVMYSHTDGRYLPEAHNGLGFSKLIFIVLQFVAFCESYRRRQPHPGVELLFLEEPEAHLHPQMQAVFIKNVDNYLQSKADWNVQLVVTTHSSHIIAEGGFAALRYFDAHSGTLDIKDLRRFEATKSSTIDESSRFLQQYMELHRCDMFFADKIILIEGMTERILLPEMIRRLASPLRFEYVSIIEVGGAYALNFRSLLEFLGVRTLIITDIDSADPGGRHKKTAVSTPGAVTTNATLKTWLPKDLAIADLLGKTADDKTDGSVRVAYQVPEEGTNAVGRSFEEAFILANADQLVTATNMSCGNAFLDEAGAALTADAVRSDSYRVAAAIESKSDFAFDILSLPSWSIPRYIQEGLEWLAPPSK